MFSLAYNTKYKQGRVIKEMLRRGKKLGWVVELDRLEIRKWESGMSYIIGILISNNKSR